MSVGNNIGGSLEVFLDLETTGFSPSFNEIIEIGAIKFKDGICIVLQISTKTYSRRSCIYC